MRRFGLAWSILAATMLLAGCSPAPAARGPAQAGWLSALLQQNTSGPYLYVAAGKVYIYPESGYNQSPVGKITSGVSNPYGLFVDQSGNLYVANQGKATVTVYPPGSTTPSATYSQDLVRPLYPLVDQYGNLWVGNGLDRHCATATIVEYQAGSQSAYEKLDVPGGEVDGMDFDQAGNLYAAFRACGRHPGGVEMFAPGSTQGHQLSVKVHQPQGLIVDSAGNLLVVDTGDHNSVDFFHPGHEFPEYRIRLPNGNVPVQIAITSDESRLFVSCYNTGNVYYTNYPLNASSTWSIEDHVSGTAQGIALSNGQTF